ncbi:hypothetical protein [Aureimonas sp. Leaf324]|jgi:hypothetical protein|uniref:hypothetical protein n=1 Tax=Aureimonas sp. Leaf324 TaxID=1736336 RepID=UPI0006F5BCAE|nr:hypothetical protein [Aureimonas sp. Leaf324]KQQ86189.1 hypothetical protein ASF65_06645 [Aureimonas sp. Leaf324]
MRNPKLPPTLFGPLDEDADSIDISRPTDDRRGVCTFNHPDNVLSDETLSTARKRAILASWASNRRAVPNRPSQRQLDSGAVVEIDEILAAICALDGVADGGRSGTGVRIGHGFRRGHFAANPGGRDDDPPPRGAAAARPFRPIHVRAVSRFAA